MEEFKALVLSPWMSPHSLYPWWDSISAVFGKKVDVVEEYEETISSPSITMRIPAVVVLRKHLTRVRKDLKFSRTNVYTRDDHRCQYCGTPKPAGQLTYDHVMPFSRGGKTTWENIVSACRSCNSRKRNRTPQEAGMRLLKQPVKPKWLPMTGLFLLPREVPALWMPYLEGHAVQRAGND